MNLAGPPCEKLSWDSDFFNLSIARARWTALDEAACQAMLAWCLEQRIDCLYLLAAVGDVATQRVIAAHRFELVDERVTLERDVAPPVEARTHAARPARLDDIPALRRIAGVAHRDSRFYTDGRFDRARCDEMYRVWIEQSVRGKADEVLVVDRGGHAAGYLTIHRQSPGAGSIGLFGVDPAHRRQGLGRVLIDGCLDWLGRAGASHVSVVTQGRNAPSRALYETAGFRTALVELWYHRWFSVTR